MRRLVVAMMVAGAAQAAQAADLPDFSALRGPVGISRGVVNWQGFYAGGQAGYGNADMDFTGANSGLMARMLSGNIIESQMGVSSWPLFTGKTSQHQTMFGGFVGYNSQWDDVVVGVEANYMHGRFSGASSASQSLESANVLTDNNYHAVTATSSASQTITDIGTIRARAGYVVGNFLPYIFGGAALGNANIVKQARVAEGYDTDPNTAAQNLANNPIVLTAGSVQNNHLLYGFSAGLGTEVNLYGNLFGRVEWEYIHFVNGVDTNINTVRGGLGYKF